ncbi:GPI-anchored wall transfer protein 1 [Gaeumannomyces tritici R3-111a-1]|uniref:GPI-anchored wall transfer protein n=1 Tax=Gaeumannomyces tritici (strain R3-111a-1) TaxID=644352 RepID=J3NRY1_GAET3|nr:GPI-anchored wall transfer protein 1 [Gaeumannomyces tritici R3-111a-1]EJT78937.1 GPI-anchored wall transfer protein 1 [Gaeumannomyces tritici R3-111a-1]
MSNSSSSASYKHQKEAFVSGHSGGSVAEICSVIGVAPVAITLWSVLQARQSFFQPYTPLAFAVDFLLNVCAVLLATTLYSDTSLLLSLLLAAPALVIFALPPSPSSSPSSSFSSRPRKRPKVPPNAESRKAAAQGGADALPFKAFLTNYRGSMMVATCLAILAVDFRLFPRRFAKVETWGTSLMDMGVGSFVYSGGLVAARPVLKEQLAGGGRGGSRTTTTTPLAQRMLWSVRHSLPLFALGVVRLLSVKGLDYAEHVTEYGVHWNFFFTLGLLPPSVAAAQSALRLVPSFAGLALLLAVVYQVLLESTDLKAFILAAPRTDLISMNREGIFSFLGYLAIFLAGMDAGIKVLPRSPGRRPLLVKLVSSTVFWSALYMFATSYSWGASLSVSRRMANLPYVLWVAWFNSATILAFYLAESLFFTPRAGSTGAAAAAVDPRVEKETYMAASSRVLRAINRNGLAVFLVANLLTGLVNMTVPTLDVGPAATMGILVGYAATFTGVAVGLDMYNISIKL